MRHLSERLAAISRADGSESLQEARELMRQLSGMNLRWNRPGLVEFLKRRQKELFL